MVSTPTIKGDSRIEDAYLLSTQEEWNVPCPECGAYQPFLWENVKFDKDDLDKGIDMSAGNAAVYQMNTAGKSRGNTVSMLPPIPVQNPEAST